MLFYLDGHYLLTDYQRPYTFRLPTARWLDGGHTISVLAHMRDDFDTGKTSVVVTLRNGVASPPPSTGQFQPTGGRMPAPGTPFIVAAAGDGASGEAYAEKAANLVQRMNPNLFLYLGDVYERGTPTEFFNWYGKANKLLGRFRSITDPTVGNHEYLTRNARGYFRYWHNIPKYYSYDAQGWHFISLDSNTSYVSATAGSAQYEWLKQDLAAQSANKCILVYYHHPIYTIGPEKPATSMIDAWKLMEQFGVDIVLNGHDHDYQRWKPLNGSGQFSTNGITEIVAGTAGHGLQTFLRSDSRVAYANDKNPAAFGILLLQLNPRGANFNFRNTSGSVLDAGVIPCVPASPDAGAPTTPGSFSAAKISSTQVKLSWTPSSDNVGVTGYAIFRNGTRIATVQPIFPVTRLAYTDKTVFASRTYKYSVYAYDLAGNHSIATAPISITTAVNQFAQGRLHASSNRPGTTRGSAALHVPSRLARSKSARPFIGSN